MQSSASAALGRPPPTLKGGWKQTRSTPQTTIRQAPSGHRPWSYAEALRFRNASSASCGFVLASVHPAACGPIFEARAARRANSDGSSFWQDLDEMFEEGDCYHTCTPSRLDFSVEGASSPQRLCSLFEQTPVLTILYCPLTGMRVRLRPPHSQRRLALQDPVQKARCLALFEQADKGKWPVVGTSDIMRYPAPKAQQS